MSHPSTQNPVLAALLALGMCAFVAAALICGKLLGQDVLGTPLHPLQVSFGRFLFAFVSLCLAYPVLRPRFRNPHLPRHVLRSLSGFIGVTFMFAATTLMPLSDATAISFLNPVICMILAIPFLGERVGPVRWLAASIAFIGAMILLRPGFDGIKVGALFALGAAALFGIELIFIKLLSRTESAVQILFVNNFIGLILATCAASFVWQSPNAHQWLALAGTGLFMVCAQACFVNAMRLADASFVAPITYASLIFSGLYDGVLFNQYPDKISIIGGAVILSGALLLAWREGLKQQSN